MTGIESAPAPSLTRTQVLHLLAHHEAGHAVVAHYEGIKVTSLELREYTNDGAWSADGITYVTYLPRLADGFALQGAAGELASLKWLDAHGLRSEETLAAANADHDRDEVTELLAQDGITISWPDVQERAQDKIRVLWPQISAVAHAAVEKGRLTEAEITELLTTSSLRFRKRHGSPMTGREFRETHGDPAHWDDDEYEAYFAITTSQTTTPDDYQPAA